MSHNQVLDDLPWLAPDAIQQIELFLESRDQPRVFEWGAGGSTLFFAQHAKRVSSIEHDSKWYEKVVGELLVRAIKNVKLEFAPDSFEYVESIRHRVHFFDLILVDGIQRNACVFMALPYLHKGSWLVLDNTERETEYAEALSLLKDWERHDYQGDGFVTSIFVKP